MNRRLPAALAALTTAVTAVLLALSGRAQEAPSSARMAFADTTLLRDTLNLKFDLLFPLADSLRLDPGYLRMLSVRYRTPLPRMMWLSDSLHMPVDSVGAIMERERFNPLANVVHQRLSAFTYTSGYTVTQEGRASWSNGSEYQLSTSALRIRNVTNVSIDRLRGDLTGLSRNSETEADWVYSPNLSAGTRVSLIRDQGFGAFGSGASSNSEYQVTIRSKQAPRRSLRSTLNLFLGPFDEPLSTGASAKRGLSSVVNGSLEYNHGGWLLYNVDGRLTSRLGRGRLPDRDWLDIRELFGTVRGNLSLYERTPVSLRLVHEVQRNRAENPDTVSVVSPSGIDTTYFLRRLPSGHETISLALNLRHGNRGTLTATGELDHSDRLLNVGGIGRTSSGHGASLKLDGRYTLLGWSIDTHFSLDRPESVDPLRISTVRIDPGPPADTLRVPIDYRQQTKTLTRSFDLTLDRALSRRISVRAKTHVYLGSPRSVILGPTEVAGVTLVPVEPRDNYEDGLELSGTYTPSPKLTSSLALEIGTRDAIALLAVSSGRNTHIRTYRGQWSWSYQLLPGLTATQRDQISADYTYFPFASTQDQLTMRYDIRTTLNAVVSPRFRIDLTHASEDSPRGFYVTGVPGVDDHLRITSRTRAYNLASNITYSPAPAIALTLSPNYRADAIGGGLQKTLNMAGGGSLNVMLGRSGSLSGNMARTYTVRSAGTAGGRSSGTYSWSGSLQLVWNVR